MNTQPRKFVQVPPTTPHVNESRAYPGEATGEEQICACLGRGENRLHELVVVEADVAAALGVETLEALAELLDDNAAADEAVKGDSRRRTTVSTRNWRRPFEEIFA